MDTSSQTCSSSPTDPAYTPGEVLYCDELSYYETREYYCCQPRWDTQASLASHASLPSSPAQLMPARFSATCDRH
jgi:hypothetical protein